MVVPAMPLHKVEDGCDVSLKCFAWEGGLLDSFVPSFGKGRGEEHASGKQSPLYISAVLMGAIISKLRGGEGGGLEIGIETKIQRYIVSSLSDY